MFGLFKKKKSEAALSNQQVTSDNATIYISDPSLLGSKVLDTLKGVQSYEGLSEGDTATGLRLRLKAGKVVMNFMPVHIIEEHLAGMSGYAEQMVQDRERLPYVLTRISEVRFVIGCVITPGFDDDGTILEVLMNLNSCLNGLFFLGDCSIVTANCWPVQLASNGDGDERETR
jgi:hypothetical protein